MYPGNHGQFKKGGAGSEILELSGKIFNKVHAMALPQSPTGPEAKEEESLPSNATASASPSSLVTSADNEDCKDGKDITNRQDTPLLHDHN